MQKALIMMLLSSLSGVVTRSVSGVRMRPCRFALMRCLSSHVAPSATGLFGSAPTLPHASVSKKEFITDERFSDLPISAESKRGIKDVLGYEYMTTVQAQTLPPILAGKDCLAKAKTGTGKTLGFLIPTVQLVRDTPPPQHKDAIMSLILSPTRELASQIAEEAKQLTQYEGMNIVCVIGGTNINTDIRRLSKRVDMLIATPGRLVDHLENTPGFADRCQVSCSV